MRWRYALGSNRGLTLTELLLAMTTSGLLMGTVVSAFIHQQKSYDRQAQIADMTLNARTAVDHITRALRTAGYGVPQASLGDWVDWVRDTEGRPVELTSPVQVIPDKWGQDMLILVGCFAPPIAMLQGLPVPFSTRDLELRYTASTRRPDTGRRKVLYIGRNEHALVTALKRRHKRGDLVRIDTDPRKAGDQGLSGTYRAALKDRLPVEILGVITYRIDKANYDTPTPVLKRDENTGGGAQPLAEYIETLRITRQDPRTVTISVTARTPKPDPHYRHPTAHDGYRRLTLTSTVQLRNGPF